MRVNESSERSKNPCFLSDLNAVTQRNASMQWPSSSPDTMLCNVAQVNGTIKCDATCNSVCSASSHDLNRATIDDATSCGND